MSERATLRRLVDAARRAAIDWDAIARCAGCGVEMVEPTGEPRYLRGCRTCADRRAKHRRRAQSDPVAAQAPASEDR